MSSLMERLKSRSNAAAAEREVKVFGNRDGWPMAGHSMVSPNRYVIRLVEATTFKTNAGVESFKVRSEVIAVLASGYKAGESFGEKVSYGEPNKAGETIALLAGKPANDPMVVKDIKAIVAAMQGVDPTKLPANAANYIINDETTALVLEAYKAKETEALAAFPAFSYAVLLRSGEVDSLVDPCEEGVEEDDVLSAARALGILPKKASRQDEGSFLAQVADQCKCIPLGLDYTSRFAHGYLICESFVQENKGKTGYYAKQNYKPASEATLKQVLSPEAYKAYVAYRQLQ
jgi:hypothetical protein